MSALKMAPPAKKQAAVVSLPERMVLAACGGMGAATFCHPIDTIRINMQIRQYKSGVDAVRSIIKPGIIQGLYPGVDAAYLRQWTYGSCRMGLFAFMGELRPTRHDTTRHDATRRYHPLPAVGRHAIAYYH